MLYLAGLACFTLYPLPSGESGPGITYGIPPQFNPFNFILDIMKDGWKALFQTVFNVVLFIPLGFIAASLPPDETSPYYHLVAYHHMPD